MLFSMRIGPEIILSIRISAHPRNCSLSESDVVMVTACLRGFLHGYFGRAAEHPLLETPLPEHRIYDVGYLAGSQQAPR
jgi:hypothetical protein